MDVRIKRYPEREEYEAAIIESVENSQVQIGKNYIHIDLKRLGLHDPDLSAITSYIFDLLLTDVFEKKPIKCDFDAFMSECINIYSELITGISGILRMKVYLYLKNNRKLDPPEFIKYNLHYVRQYLDDFFDIDRVSVIADNVLSKESKVEALFEAAKNLRETELQRDGIIPMKDALVYRRNGKLIIEDSLTGKIITSSYFDKLTPANPVTSDMDFLMRFFAISSIGKLVLFASISENEIYIIDLMLNTLNRIMDVPDIFTSENETP